MEFRGEGGGGVPLFVRPGGQHRGGNHQVMVGLLLRSVRGFVLLLDLVQVCDQPDGQHDDQHSGD